MAPSLLQFRLEIIMPFLSSSLQQAVQPGPILSSKAGRDDALYLLILNYDFIS